jgi:rhodanese-related sulfurtransferase
MKHISIDAFKQVLEAEKNNDSIDFINVCEPAEYKEKHITGVRSVPLGTLESHLDEFFGKQTVYVHCRSGNRGKQAIEKMQAAGVTAELVNVEGGITAWDEAGHPTNSFTSRMPLMRQVLLAAGLLILFGVIAAHTISESFRYLVIFVGAGLTFSGLTGWCGMAMLLSKMPWNK